MNIGDLLGAILLQANRQEHEEELAKRAEESKAHALQLTVDRLAIELKLYKEAARLYREATLTSHDNHWYNFDGLCPTCKWIGDLRERADKLLEGL